MNYDNEITVIMDSKSENESFARIVIVAFISSLDPTINELTDVKTAVSEAVTNAIIHGYENKDGKVTMTCRRLGNEIFIEIKDEGTGILNIEEAMSPLYTSKPEQERSGMGFTLMETFMDSVKVESVEKMGTTVLMSKKFGKGSSSSLD